MNREEQTIKTMIQIYCRAHHGGSENLCADCAALLAYAAERIAKCPFGADKPACNTCAVHCYESEKRERVRAVMRFSGPRMLGRHPFLAVRHLIRAWRYSGKRSK